MQGHHAAHGGAEALVIILLDLARFHRCQVQPVANELGDPRIDLLPQIDVVRIERVVEVEHPGVDMGKGAGEIHFHSLSVDRGDGPALNRRPGESQDPYAVTDHWGTPVVVLCQTQSWSHGSWLSPGRQRSASHRYDHDTTITASQTAASC